MLGVIAATSPVHATTGVHTVLAGQSIQDAIDAANEGDTIFVYNGTYYEHVSITKNVSLLGLDRETTIIDGGSNGTVVKLNANGASVRGFTLRNGGSDPGILMNNSNGNFVEDNIIVNNYNGIDLEQSRNNVIEGNVIQSNEFCGIYNVLLSSNNIISGNSFESNGFYGIFVASLSTGNIVYHNNFNDTNFEAFNQIGIDNVWDYEGEGNHWSDYQGLDSDQDGIGDTAYPIYSLGNYTDNYPLMGRFSYFSAVFQKQVFEVTVISNSSVSDFRFELGSETGNKIIRYHAEGENNTLGFSRVRIPRALMDDPYTVIAGEDVSFKLLVPDSTYAYLYFTYNHTTQTIIIFTSKAMSLYADLLRTHLDMETDLAGLNSTNHTLLANYSSLLSNYTQLQQDYNSLNYSNQRLLDESNSSIRNIQSLSYIFAATVAVFIVITVYLSKKTREPLNRGTSPRGFEANSRPSTEPSNE